MERYQVINFAAFSRNVSIGEPFTRLGKLAIESLSCSAPTNFAKWMEEQQLKSYSSATP
jgi:hypothetical protein